ncbi:MAG: glycerophosphodiester phosphodiesterase family protein [Kiritimatiellales bacterium]
MNEFGIDHITLGAANAAMLKKTAAIDATVAGHTSQLADIATNYTKVSDIVYPLYICHRGGACNIYPENTMSCYKINDGYSDLPLKYDIRKTLDSQYVICHDSIVDTTSNGTGTIASKTLEQLKLLDFGAWKNAAFTGEKVPTVDEVITFLGKRKIHFADVKEDAAAVAIAQKIINAGLIEYVVLCVQYSSFSIVDTIKAIDSRFHIMANYYEGNPLTNAISTAVEKGISFINVPRSVATAQFAADCAAVGIRPVVYYMRSQYEAAKYVALGYDGLMCKNPAYIAGKYNSVMTRPWTLDLSSGLFGQEMIYLEDVGAPITVTMADGALESLNTTGTPRVMVGSPVITGNCKLLFTITPKAFNADASRYIGIQLMTQDEASSVFDPMETEKNGYMFMWTRDGTMRILKGLSGQTRSFIAEQTGTGAMEQDVAVNFEVTLGTTTVTFKRLDTGTTLTANDATFRTGLHFGIYWSQNQSAVSAISVTNS